MNQELETPDRHDRVQEMLLLAERLRENVGGDLDDDAILAVSEATGLPTEYIRVAVTRLPEADRKRSLGQQIRHSILSLDPGMRRFVGSGVLGANLALMNVLAVKTGDQYGLINTVAIVLAGLAVWNLAVTKDSRTGLTSGALLGGVYFVARSLFSLVASLDVQIPAALLIPFVLGGGLAGFVFPFIRERFSKRLGLKDPLEERQELLKQLVDLQDKLRSGEQAMSFLSLDVVGSTRMKESADSLSVEYTFTEYHKWVEWVAKRFGGQVHSTAGDGVTCAFPHPQMAFQAARFMQSGLVELNTFRNKIGVPIQLRAGIHHGTVNNPGGTDITKLNFAHVIDVAAHMQKVAPVGGIVVSEAAAAGVMGGPAVIGTDMVEVSNVKGFVWHGRPAAAPPTTDGPPPLPA